MSYLLHSSVVLETREKGRFHTMLHFLWRPPMPQYSVLSLFVKKLNTEREQDKSSAASGQL